MNRDAGNLLEWADGVWSPVVSARWRQAFGDVDGSTTAQMHGVPSAVGSFESEASGPDGGVEVGGHLTFQPMATAATIEVGYEGFISDEVIDHVANATVRVPF